MSREAQGRPPFGEEDGFRAAALECLNGLYGFALSVSRDPSVADDLVQETYLRALAARRKVDSEENMRVWLFVILQNVWRNQVRRPRRDQPADDPETLHQFADSREGPDEQLERQGLRRRLR